MLLSINKFFNLKQKKKKPKKTPKVEKESAQIPYRSGRIELFKSHSFGF